MIVITRNRASVLRDCLDHLLVQVEPPGQIVVVDSSDRFEPLEMPGVDHVAFPAGKAQMPKARNEGARLSTRPLVAYVDDDCLVDPDWLQQIAQTYRNHPQFVGVGGRISDARWQYRPDLPIGKVFSDGSVVSNFFGDPGGVQEVDILPGGNMSFRRDWILRVGGFDPRYVATNHREDPDFCLRIRAAGGRIGYQPKAHALHLNARTSLGELKPWHEFYLRYSFARNEAFFLSRHFPREVLRRWWEDGLAQARRAFQARSLVGLLCVPVQFVSFALGVGAYWFTGRRVPGEQCPSAPSTKV